MRLRLGVVPALIGLLSVLGIGERAGAADIAVLSALGMQPVLDELGRGFEQITGHKVVISYGAAGAVLKRIGGFATADIVILPEESIRGVLTEDEARDARLLARSGIGIAVRKGTLKPDI